MRGKKIGQTHSTILTSQSVLTKFSIFLVIWEIIEHIIFLVIWEIIEHICNLLNHYQRTDHSNGWRTGAVESWSRIEEAVHSRTGGHSLSRKILPQLLWYRFSLPARPVALTSQKPATVLMFFLSTRDKFVRVVGGQLEESWLPIFDFQRRMVCPLWYGGWSLHVCWNEAFFRHQLSFSLSGLLEIDMKELVMHQWSYRMWLTASQC